MATQINSFSPDDNVSDIVAALRRDGAAIVRDVVTPEVMDSLSEKFNSELEEQEPGGDVFYGGKMRMASSPFARGPEFSEHLLLNPLLLDITDAILLPKVPMGPSAAAKARKSTCEADAFNVDRTQVTFPVRDPIVGPNCHHYRMCGGGIIQVCGGGGDQPLHREMDIYQPYIPHDPTQPDPVLSIGFAATDFTVENGATRVVPGSHLWPAERIAEKHEEAQAVMSKGSVILWMGRALHGLAPNRTDEPRTGVFFLFSVDWLREGVNSYLTVPPEVARELPKEAQQLLGYRASETLNNAFGRNPECLLEEVPGAKANGLHEP